MDMRCSSSRSSRITDSKRQFHMPRVLSGQNSAGMRQIIRCIRILHMSGNNSLHRTSTPNQTQQKEGITHRKGRMFITYSMRSSHSISHSSSSSMMCLHQLTQASLP